jgi:hypothetical protein
MAIGIGVGDAPVYSNNSSKTSKVTCACCDKFKIEPQKTVTELRSAQKISKLLQEKINAQLDRKYTRMLVHHNKNYTELEVKKREGRSYALIASEERQ